MEMWYQMVNNPSVEYSTDLDFFLKHQITVWRSGHKYEYCSRLESKCFFMEQANSSQNYEFSEEHILEVSKRIHKEILDGKHGAGKFVD